ncbi:MAG: DUF2281 domain-containing protein [bacterium]|nr:DUF2281 domain-containing protein [bacterium]
MHIVKIDEAKVNLSRLIQEALDGEEVIIAKGNNSLVKLVVVENTKKGRRLGSAKDAIRLMPDFDEPLDDFKEYM